MITFPKEKIFIKFFRNLREASKLSVKSNWKNIIFHYICLYDSIVFAKAQKRKHCSKHLGHSIGLAHF